MKTASILVVKMCASCVDAYAVFSYSIMLFFFDIYRRLHI